MNNDNYEKNLKLNYEAVRKDLDILLSHTIPMQKNLIKTYLWVNFLLLGYIMHQISQVHISTILFGLLILIWVLSLISIYCSLRALTFGQEKFFGHIDISIMGKIKEDQYEHINGLNKMLEATKSAFDQNARIISKRAQYISYSLRYTLSSLGIIFLYGVIYLNIK